MGCASQAHCVQEEEGHVLTGCRKIAGSSIGHRVNDIEIHISADP